MGDSDVKEVFEELVEGVIGIADDEDEAFSLVVDGFGEKSADEGFTGPYVSSNNTLVRSMQSA